MNTSNIIITVILVIILIPAVRGAVTHLKGEGSCCGGPKEKVQKKKIKGKPLSVLTIHIDGMKCDNCKNRVENAINGLDGVVAKVSLGKKQAKVYCYQDIDEDIIKSKIEGSGYHVVA